MTMRTLLSSLPLALALVVPACAQDDAPSDPVHESSAPERRQKIGKADLVGSCQDGDQNFCGTKTGAGNCWCDAACSGYGDCCADYESTCEETEACSPVLCALACEHGFDKDEDGCEICSCADAPDDTFCGGFAGLPCPDGKICVDDPNDSCDPQNGGADCGGICVDEPTPTNTCENKCGGPAEDKSCYCDEACTSYQDCCEDYDAFCGEERTPASGACVKNGGETCTTDADCMVGGCGGALCYNPSFGGGFTTCECAGPGAPVAGCGCVAGQCSWYN